MRLRIKEPLLNINTSLEATDLTDLRSKISADISGEAASENHFDLSLNGTDMLPLSGAFSDHGIVAGDRIRVHLVASISTPPPLGDIFSLLKFRLDVDTSGQKTYSYGPIPGAKMNFIKSDIPSSTIYVVNLIGTYEATVFTESFVANSEDEKEKLTEILPKVVLKFKELSGLAKGFLALPDEILLDICARLDAKSLVRLSATCKRLQKVGSDESLWKRLYFKNFTTIGLDEASWRKLYGLSYQRDKSAARPRGTQSEPNIQVPPRPIFPDPLFPAPRFPGVPGMIGGDYDLRPGMPMPGGIGPIRGDPPFAPGAFQDPDMFGRRDPDAPDFPGNHFPRGGPRRGFFLNEMNLELLEAYGQNYTYPEEFDGVLDSTNNTLAASFNRRGSLLATGCNDGRIVIWDFLTRRTAKVILAHTSSICSVGWNRKGNKLVTAGTDHTVAIWNVLTNEAEYSFRFPGPVQSACFNPRNDKQLLNSSTNSDSKPPDCRNSVIMSQKKRSLLSPISDDDFVTHRKKYTIWTKIFTFSLLFLFVVLFSSFWIICDWRLADSFNSSLFTRIMLPCICFVISLIAIICIAMIL
ncbi:Oidioi.mRNA.OKI2018_I69.XSR.g14136.t1.cds [Oikopleura dioica]|uniref:Oidioi.mRNA.OKI2018_I69.XSR.g14136.t1.cds n=1 Tax=Oikopleura dioica TaxID=34765 RepID=A0ABN7S8W6_OIKDI|nr:Oidioi.mRNA.OKI2018_I69.XSR.g14136.t1.cds [Oikopleura dioica]